MSNFRAGRIVVYDNTSAFQTTEDGKILHVHLHIVDGTGAAIEMNYDSASNTIHARACRSSTDYRLALTHLRQYLESYLANLQLSGVPVPEEIRLHSNDYNEEVMKGNCSIEVLRTILMPWFGSCNGVDWYIDHDADVQAVKDNATVEFQALATGSGILDTIRAQKSWLAGGLLLIMVVVASFKLGQRYPINRD